MLFPCLVLLLSNSSVPFFTVQSESKPPVEDKSLTVAEYTKLGMPDIDKEWGEAELAEAVRVMKELKKTPEKLPRHQSTTSGAVFAKMTHASLIEIADEKDLPIEKVTMSRVARMLAIRDFSQCYNQTGWPRRTMTVEFVECADRLLDVVRRLQLDADKLQKSIDKDDPVYETRMKGIKQAQEGSSSVIGAVVKVLYEKKYMTAITQKRLASVIEQRVPAMVKSLPASMRTLHELRIADLIKNETDTDIKETLQRTYTSMKK